MTTMQCFSGLMFDMTIPPDVDQYQPSDVAYHLAHINRYNGAFGQYNVADHSIRVMLLTKRVKNDPIVLLAALLHDLHESYIGDLCTPFVQALSPEAQAEIASKKIAIDAAFIMAKFADRRYPSGTAERIFEALRSKEVKWADRVALLQEAAYFVGGCATKWAAWQSASPADILIAQESPFEYPLSADEAQYAFFQHYNQLRKEIMI